jgi:hypothetical protein
MVPWEKGFDMEFVSISDADVQDGNPKKGGMLARNKANVKDMWYINPEYFKENYERKYQLCR